MTDIPAPPELSQAHAWLRAKYPTMAPADVDALYRDLLAESARGDNVQAVCDFGELVFGHVAADHHRAWIEEILEHKRMAATAPPESAKTTWVTQTVTAWWIGKHPLTTNGICSAGDTAAEKMASVVADTIEKSPMWAKVFPSVVPDKGRGWSGEGYHIKDTSVTEGEWVTKRYGQKDASLLGAGVGSAKWNGVRITGIFVLDDMHARSSKTQQATNDDTVGFFKDTAEFRATASAHIAIVQTRWNSKDIIAYCKTRPSFRVFEHPAILTDDDGAERSYWPEYHSLDSLQEKRAAGPIDFELVFQGNDKAIEGTVLKAEWLVPYVHTGLDEKYPRYFGIDPAKRVKQILTKGDDPDSFRIAMLVSTGLHLVVEDMFGGVMFAPDAEDLYFTLAGKFKPKVTGIEVNGLGNEYYQNFLRRMTVLGLHHVLLPIRTTLDMGERMAEISPYFASGQIRVSDQESAGLQAFRAEWVMFPRGHDDTLSAVHIGWKVAAHHLPHESPDQRKEREARARTTVHPARVIEGMYHQAR